MKALLAICMIITTTFVWASESTAPNPHDNATVTGKVLEVKNVQSYTYLRLMTLGGETWAAILKTPVKKGATVTIENVSVMNNFESKTLKKTFPTILFGTLGGTAASAASVPAGHVIGSSFNAPAKQIEAPSMPATDTADVQVPKASGANAKTVAEIVSNSSELKDKPVLVRGKVVKYNPDIMGKNWIHLRDGSGSAADNSNDILVTTTHTVKLGDIVTVKGIVHTDKDFGAGYAYKVLIEEATLQ